MALRFIESKNASESSGIPAPFKNARGIGCLEWRIVSIPMFEGVVCLIESSPFTWSKPMPTKTVRPIEAPVKSASSSVVKRKTAASNLVFVRFAPTNCAANKSAAVSCAPEKFAPFRSLAMNLARVRFALVKSEFL